MEEIEDSEPQLINPVPEEAVYDALTSLSNEANEFYLDSYVQEIDVAEISTLSFYRDWVAPNKPVIIKSAIKEWKAYKLWNSTYLRERMGEHQVTVAVTPNGYADAPLDSYFVMPEEKEMKFSHFLDILEEKEAAPDLLRSEAEFEPVERIC